MEPIHRIVFNGEIHEGLSPKKVRANAAVRLNVSVEQIDRMFSGKRVVLKNGISKAAAVAYMARLAKLGMIVHVERMPAVQPAVAVAAEPVVAPTAAPAPARKAPPAPTAQTPARRTPSMEDSWLSSSSFANLARTHLNLARAEALLNNSEYTGSIPDANEARPWPELNVDSDTPETPEPSVEAVAQPAVEAPNAPIAAPAATEPEPEPEPEQASTPAPVEAVLTLNGTFACSHCGTLHQLQTSVQAVPDAG